MPDEFIIYTIEDDVRDHQMDPNRLQIIHSQLWKNAGENKKTKKITNKKKGKWKKKTVRAMGVE